MIQDRGTGRTKNQMAQAPADAVFVWCNSNLFYPKKLALHIGRSDLQIKPRNWVMSQQWMGLRRAVVIDHAFLDLPTKPAEHALLNELLAINAIYLPVATPAPTPPNAQPAV